MPALQHRELKSTLIADGTFDEFMKQRKALYKLGADCDDRECYTGYEEDELTALFQLKEQRYHRRTKLNKWFDYWLQQKDKQIYFLTFTFNDIAMSESDIAKKRYVSRNIEKYDDYCLNIDYGKTTERLHYHCLLVMDPEADEFMNWKWSKKRRKWYCNDCCLFNDKKGKIDIMKVDPSDNDALKKYQSKLTSHGIKTNGTKLGFKKKSRYQESVKYEKMINGVIRYQHRHK